MKIWLEAHPPLSPPATAERGVHTMNMYKVNNKNTFVVNFEHIAHLVLLFLLVTLNMELLAGRYKNETLAQKWVKYLAILLKRAHAFECTIKSANLKNEPIILFQ